MVSKDKLKIIAFFLFSFLVLTIIILFPKTSAKELRKKNYTTLKAKLEEYKDGNNWKKFKDKKIEIIFWHNLGKEGNNQEILQQIISKFQEKYQNITVKEEFKGNWGTLTKNINVALPANNEPHLIVSYPDFLVNYYESGKLVPLNDFIFHKNEEIKLEKEEKENTFFYPIYEEESQIALGEEEKKWYSLPFTKNVELMFYNQTYLKNLLKRISKEDFGKIKKCFKDKQPETGELKDGITWEELKTLSEIIKKHNPQKIPISYESESNLFIVSSEQKNIEYTNPKTTNDQLGVGFNNQDAQKMIRDLKEQFYDEKKYLITRKLSGENHTLNLFAKQDILMNINSSNGLDYVNKVGFEVGVTSCPYWEKGKRKTLQQGANINLFYKKDKDEVIASWLFLKHLTSQKANEILFLQESSQFPTRPGYVNSKGFQDKIDDYKKFSEKQYDKLSTEERKELLKAKLLVFLNNEREQDEKDKIYFFSPVFQKSYIARIVVNQLLVDCFLLKENDQEKIAQLFEIAQKKALA
ncbi:Sugar transport system substrate-binding protein, periplasmic component [Candidatus Phytoplasma australiense]|uniref:Sugar transport system substrate-binding protein, periplasmic component n=1 Tax=Phytoplasma australiense TaxID=59748 RepID=B1V8X0_PHYAS|nr:Sugar transport system substrate-binding protein, periplasmic component [Candidatus Phytoplasma australiense]